jgi:hypothetical protein
MRRFMPLIALLVAVSAVAAEPFVTVVGRKVNLIPAGKIQAACGTSKPVFGCTTMDATLLTSCNASDALYRITAAARLTPVVYMVSHTILAHEMAHVADVAGHLRSYAKALGKAVYETEEACEASARVARMTFGRRLRDFQNISALKQDGPDAGRVADAKAAASIRAALGD